MYTNKLVIITHNFGTVTGPSIALFHALRGIARFFDQIYVVNTISSKYYYDKILLQYLPSNVSIFNYQINIRPHTIGFFTISLKQKICQNFNKMILKSEDYESLYFLLWSDILNLNILTTCLKNQKIFIGYNTFFNFAPPGILLKQKIDYKNYYEISEKYTKFILSHIYHNIEYRLTKYIKHILAHTNFHKNLYIRYLQIPNNCISVIPHMIDTDFIQTLAYKKVKSSIKDKILLYAGGRSIEKGMYILLRAICKILNRNLHNFKLIMIGTPPMCKEFKKLNEKIIVLKKQPYLKFLKLISMVDAVLVPSQNELFGLVILESLSLGKPVIASNVGGVPEIIGSSYELLIRPGDEEHLASVICDFLENKIDTNEEYLINIAKRFDRTAIAPRLYKSILEHGQLW
ncbi:MAG: glycosyltransferase family 4 protein [Ignisphaera sp.]